MPGRVDSAVHAHALYGAAFLTYRQDDYERAAALCEESLAMARRLDDRAGTAFALNGLGNIAFGRGDHRRALAHYEESLALRRALNDANEKYWNAECEDCSDGECSFCGGTGECPIYQGAEDDHSECDECGGTNKCDECGGDGICAACKGTNHARPQE